MVKGIDGWREERTNGWRDGCMDAYLDQEKDAVLTTSLLQPLSRHPFYS